MQQPDILKVEADYYYQKANGFCFKKCILNAEDLIFNPQQ